MATEIQKSQEVRLIDILALGPFLIWYAGQKEVPELAKWVLAVSGILTITYNLDNYLANIQERRESKCR